MSHLPFQNTPGNASLSGFVLSNLTDAPTSSKTNPTAILDPTASNDSTQGYSKLSTWINTVNNSAWMCLDASVGASVWVELSNEASQSVSSLKQTIIAPNAFTVGTVVTRKVSSYEGAQANSYDNVKGFIGVVESATASQFTLVYAGLLYWPSHNFTVGNELYLSPTSAGALTATAPGNFLTIVARAVSADYIQVGFKRYTGTNALADQAVINAKLSHMEANTVKVNATGALASPTNLAIAASTILARLASGNLKACTPSEIKTLLAIGVADLSATGTKNATTYLRGDNTFAVFPASGFSSYTVFSVDGTYTPARSEAYVIVVGGSAGGGGSQTNGRGGGGGSGGISEKIITGQTIGSGGNVTVTIGAGGAGGSAAGGNGSNGGTSSFGAHASATGGGFGGGGVTNSGGGGGGGGVGSGGTINRQGGAGANGASTVGFGRGGSNGYKVGGDAGFSASSAGLAGEAGIIIVWE